MKVSFTGAARDLYRKIALIPLNAGANAAARLLDPDPGISGPAIFVNNGDTLLYGVTQNGVGNIWVQPAKGGPARQVTSFSSERIEHYQVSPDGKNILLTRSHSGSDVLLLRDKTTEP